MKADAVATQEVTKKPVRITIEISGEYADSLVECQMRKLLGTTTEALELAAKQFKSPADRALMSSYRDNLEKIAPAIEHLHDQVKAAIEAKASAPVGQSKVATGVDRELLETCVKDVEHKGPCENQTTMLKSVANLYNSRKSLDLKAISYTIVRLRIGEWAIPHKSMPQVKPLNRGGKS
jgi:hypothetical protein